ncbi:hypothetical protein WH96_20235 [Kiloniella spongiae]|uniref:Methyltransferase type 11 domain-containing protein n=1 Tax=Kiloniella spongiae TaxID=1489064 RepID=A0A0H2M8Z0_9PROT|nr:putative sugar O-methyltransferase [Kiloniella spongiae]KLN58954.1 hypothetical protein WH96_20235 [Kiloniella spongiae]
MLDASIFQLIKEQDFISRSALELRPYAWGSLDVYEDAVQKRMSRYHSKYDLLHWLTFWTEQERLVSPFTGNKEYEELRSNSAFVHKNVLKMLFSSGFIKSEPHAGYDIWNAIDGHIVSQICPDAKSVLDFGSGYGRLGAVFGDTFRNGVYVSVDCIEVSYILQNLFLSLMAPARFHEYCDYAFERRSFKVDCNNENAIYHLPSWRLDLVGANQIDLITAVFVLPEINEFALLDFVKQANRMVRDGGYIYLRDHLYHSGEDNHSGAHRFNTEELLSASGFQLIYQGKYKDNIDIYGIPRIYKKTGKSFCS